MQVSSVKLNSGRILLRSLTIAAALISITSVVNSYASSSDVKPASAKSFEIKAGNFLLDGKPIQLISGEIHYPRIPHEYWRQRLRMAKACGLNTITTYVFWNMHEPEKGKFNFKGDADVAQFIKIAQEEGLFVILRPGPYVCAEWDFGGFPYWLLNEKGMTVRTRDPKFMEYTQRYFTELAKQLIPLQVDHGGNIVMVQVENEYGSYGSDRVYMGMVRDALLKAGFTASLFMCDGGSQLANDYLPGLLPGENGGSGPQIKANIDKYYPGGPYFVPEHYPGWLDHWGAPMVRVSTASVVRSTERMLNGGISFNYYMFHGGTNFAFTNGANFGGAFEPDITSYDYDAPMDEAGRATPKYMAIRNAIGSYLKTPLPAVPVVKPAISIPEIKLGTVGSLAGTLGAPVVSAHLKTMEDLGQDYGFVLYRTKLHGPISGKLAIKDVRDYAVVLVDGKRIAVIDRRRKTAAPEITSGPGEHTLDILVENCGRINFGSLLTDNHKGITEYVKLAGTELTGWQMFKLPFANVSRLKFDGEDGDGPTLRQGHFEISTLGDTYLDLSGWTKGVVFVNGHNLGRFWGIGPQQTMYLPAPWLKKGANTITVLDLLPGEKRTIAGLTEPRLDELHKEEAIVKKRPAPSTIPEPTAAEQVVAGEFKAGDGPQDVKFDLRSGRYVCFQAKSSYDGDYASCAELFLLDANGKPLARDGWKIYYTDSEETAQEDGSAENMIDDDEGTIWHSVWSENHSPLPHFVVIDLGKQTQFSGLRYLSRKGDKPAKTRGFALFASDYPFTSRK